MEQVNLETEPTTPYERDSEHERLARLAGEWRGTARTIMGPGAEPLDAAWEGRIAGILGGRFVRFVYRSSVEGKPIVGEMLIAFESGEKLWRTSWVDSFHTGTMILVSEGRGTDIDVRGRYFAAEGHPHWGWRTVIDDAQAEKLTIRMYNITPDGQEFLGVEITLARGA
ncbi:DUF1579 family protein [Polyangium sorediatum]|uniref:DUF1579 family protein n=1 Tax=Polyangium sorediatum TaxID=889274 RepID=A0ABT6NSJ9_9BACT|nr:DUF1579 family protein [Polyangium sorediatum]MDI1431263.1 DUF1579 family protein [Polyangium sorediatum]